jgi:hypothetical protein
MRERLVRVLSFARAHRIHLAATTSVFVLAVLLAFPVVRGWIWSVTFVDILVLITFVGAVLLASLGKRDAGPSAGLDRARPYVAPEGLTAIVAAIAIFVTYASFRNQTRLAAETGLNTEGQMLFEMEMDNPNLRCLYTNFAHDDAQACLRRFVNDPNEWSAGIFYIEGVFWLLEKAEEDRKAWGSVYSKDIDYWRQYVNEDPTGLFSFYLVSFHGSYDGARQGMKRAAVEILDLCRKYRSVRLALEQARANSARPIPCP